MTERNAPPRFPTSIGASDLETITLLGQDLAADLMGKVSFGELALWLVTQQRPTTSQVRVFEAVLVALADHGFTPTAIAARLTYLSAPESVQGALAAAVPGSSASPRTAAGSWPPRWPRRPVSPSRTTTRAGTRWHWRPCGRPVPMAGSSLASATRCTRSPTRGPRR
jgi:hypothetical protein